ncbi:pentapeptide repeat-containing protein [Pseudomonas putida]|uniref:Pentapeptide repeat-containing protein n=1 Tax=Pseudomonas putida TaxID=303 RepID=A0A8I1JKT5_PSEPU|nr:pentapeptide repeat-containing protein [Pseudomonas putida]MBI6885069.1 pentapeptide repeat-containing protein [Pseudomonas putida]
MNIDSLVLTRSEISEIRDRWKTTEGIRIKRELLDLLRAGSWDWPDLLIDLPKISIPASQPNFLDDLRGLELQGEMLDGVSMSHSDLSYSIFEACSLKKASFQGGRLSWANLRQSQMQHADLLQVAADHAVFDGCNLAGAMMLSGDYRNGSFKKADLRRSIMNGCRLMGADLHGAQWHGAEVFNVDIARPGSEE